MWVRALVECDARAGGKAHGLARLIAAGLPVPPGFVIEPIALEIVLGDSLAAVALDEIGHRLEAMARALDTAPIPAELDHAVTAAAHGLGPLAVRSSAAIEDRASGAAPGVYASVVDVAPAELWTAVRTVWKSALAPLAIAYARRANDHDLDVRAEMNVIVQRFVPGDRVTAYTRPPGSPGADEVWIQRAGTVAHVSRSSADPIVELALRAETAIGVKTGADVELVVADDGHIAVVQARAIVHPVVRVRHPPPQVVLAPLDDGRVWTWDIAHNPDPLSLAQAGLVDHVDRARVAPWSMRVCAGYLYFSPREEIAPPDVTSVEQLEDLAAEIEARLDQLLRPTAPVPELRDAIDCYVRFYEIWSRELVPLIRVARHDLTPDSLLGARPSAIEHVLFAAARGELDEAAAFERLGVYAPAWDVAMASFGEQPAVLLSAIERARVAIRRIPSGVAAAATERALGRTAADLAERDDLYFARAQHVVRRALLERAHALAIDPEDIWWLPLDEIATTSGLDRDDARRRAAGARAAATRAAEWQMPIVVGAPAPESMPPLTGVGTGPRVTGRVVRLATLGSVISVGHGDVVVTRAITPALAVIVMGCAAIVSETGGLLDHGAAMARELGIPCVVGCHDAWSLLYDGMIVTVDGDAGTVTR
ncbi:MAG TPA: PEP/pyruvate-binding domain-containing protein [Kofleriaceae bacterium]|nr:PEP/pyruvate-binding domain-containing protein [Kofleriaceae bacterium]